MVCSKDQEDASTSVKQSLIEAPVLALPDADKPFSVVCDASDFAIGSALTQKDDDGIDQHLLSVPTLKSRGIELPCA